MPIKLNEIPIEIDISVQQNYVSKKSKDLIMNGGSTHYLLVQ